MFSRSLIATHLSNRDMSEFPKSSVSCNTEEANSWYGLFSMPTMALPYFENSSESVLVPIFCFHSFSSYQEST